MGLNTIELIARVRMNVFFKVTTHPDYTDAWILNELYDQELGLFERSVVNAREGYWLHMQVYQSTPLNQYGLIPLRACANGLESVQISYETPNNWAPCDALTEQQVTQFDLPSNQLGTPFNYVVRGDHVWLIPAPNNAAKALRLKYYQRPSKLVLPQDGTDGTTSRGLITSCNPTTRVIIMNAIPFNQLATPPAALSGTQLFDVVRPGGWHEVVYSGSATFSGTTITDTFSPDDMRTIMPGDFVRLRNQSEWPQLPEDYHRCLADATAIKICTQLRMSGKAEDLAVQLNADLGRFQDMITPRAKNNAKDIVMPNYLYGSGPRGRRVWG